MVASSNRYKLFIFYLNQIISSSVAVILVRNSLCCIESEYLAKNNYCSDMYGVFISTLQRCINKATVANYIHTSMVRSAYQLCVSYYENAYIDVIST